MTGFKAHWRHRGPHGQQHIDHQRRIALILIATALFRVGIWSALTVCYVIGVAFAVALFKSVAFVALISMFALILTDWGQFAASMAQLTAGDAHHDVEVVRKDVGMDFESVEKDIARLADLEPGPEATAVADAIRQKLVR